MIADFDNPIASGFAFNQNDALSYLRSGALGLDPGVSAPPPGDVSMYETVTTGGHATLTSTGVMQFFSFYLGSPDTYNTVTFSGPGGFSLSLSGAQIWARSAAPAATKPGVAGSATTSARSA